MTNEIFCLLSTKCWNVTQISIWDCFSESLQIDWKRSMESITNFGNVFFNCSSKFPF